MPKIKEAKYKTLVHKGPVFPEEYKPSGYKINGKDLAPLAEEMLFCAARYLESDYEKELLSNGNFWKCLKPELSADLQKLAFPQDFLPVMKKMKADQTALKEEKKNMTREEKAAIKEEKDEFKKSMVALIDGKPVDYMYTVEAPGLMISRGKDPRKFLFKYRVQPEDIIINTVGGKAPLPPKGHKWGGVVSDPTALNAFTYKIQVGRPGLKSSMKVYKKANFSAASEVKQSCVESKYDKSSDTLKNWDKIQKKIMADMNSSDEKTRQCAMVAYLIQMTGIRVGLDKDTSRFAKTVGASSLEVGNVNMWSE